MSEIYWITTIGNLSTALVVLIIVSLICLIAFCWVTAENSTQIDNEEKENYKSGLELIKKALFVIGVFIIGLIFVPSEKQMYAIYGIGGTIDYIKSNDTAKQLPDKVVNALDAWLNKQAEENKDDKQ